MLALVGILWVVYASECFVRWQRGDWVFRPRGMRAMEGVNGPDITFLDGRVAFVRTPWLPGRLSHVFSGDAFDRRGCRARLGRVRRESARLRVFSTALFAAVMVLFPILVLSERLRWSLPGFVPALAIAWAGTLWTFFRAYSRIFGARPPLETWLVLALSPVSLIRAPEVVSIRASRGTHPVVGADLLCGDEEFLRIARLWHFDAPELRPAIEKLAHTRGLRARLTAPPPVTESGVALFCSRCHATFRGTASNCADCENVVLTPLPG